MPSDDVYLENSKRLDNKYLRVETGGRKRTSYVKFDLTGINAVTAAQLAIQVYNDGGNGAIRIYQGVHSNWTEATLATNNAPAKGSELGGRTGSWSNGAVYLLDLTPPLINDGAVTLIIEMDAGGNDVSFSSSEVPYAPTLHLSVVR